MVRIVMPVCKCIKIWKALADPEKDLLWSFPSEFMGESRSKQPPPLPFVLFIGFVNYEKVAWLVSPGSTSAGNDWDFFCALNGPSC